jgi:DNA-directed RNA polymerase subunit beta
MLKLSGLLNLTPLVSSIREFFGSNPLSKFMYQTNPLTELTPKRKWSVLDPGGISRDQADFVVWDFYSSQSGWICPIETQTIQPQDS